MNNRQTNIDKNDKQPSHIPTISVPRKLELKIVFIYTNCNSIISFFITINVTTSRIVEGYYKITGIILRDQESLERYFIFLNRPETGLGKITSRA